MPIRTPSKEQRESAKAKIVEEVSGWLESRVDAVFWMADDDEARSLGSEINWHDFDELRWQICGAIADDLHHGLGDYVQEILERELRSAPPKKTSEQRPPR